MTEVRLSVDQGLQLIHGHCRLLAAEDIGVDAALGRVLAVPSMAQRDVPGVHASAMDGYAVRDADLGSRPKISGDIAAGGAPRALPPGEAMRISTGAPVPAGADRIVAREWARMENGRLVVDPSCCHGANIRLAGEDMTAGAMLLPAGAMITPDRIGALLAAGVTGVAVRRLPTVALLSTGSELATADPDARVIDSNGPMIAAAVAGLGLAARRFGAVADDPAMIDAVLDQTMEDIVISSGGVSVGEHDLIRSAIERRGATILFHGLAMRPGKPILFAVLPDGRLFFGLPGNPVAALVGFRFFVTAALRFLLGLEREDGIEARLDMDGRPATTLFLRARTSRSRDGSLCIETAGLDQRSHVLSSVAAADSWLRVDQRDDEVACRLFEKTARLC